MRLLPTLFAVGLVGFLPAHGQTTNRYGIPELGISVVRSDLSGSTANWASASLFADSNWSVNPYFDAGWSFETQVPIGVHMTSYNGISVDVGEPTHWLGSVFADIEAGEPPIDNMKRPGNGLSVGLRGQYTWDLYNFGVEISHVAPLTFHGDSAAASPNQDGGFKARLWAQAELPATRQLKFKAGLETAFADQNYNNLYFGVTAAQALETGLKQYEADAGPIHGSLMLEARYLINRDWALRASSVLTRYLGPADASPVIQERGAFASLVEAGVVYRF